MADKATLLALAERLADYQPCLDPGTAICDRRIVDEAVAALRTQAQDLKP